MRNILLIEDDKALSEAIATTLELYEFNVIAVDCKEKALMIFKSNDIDAVVSDVNLGSDNGHNILLEIRKSNKTTPFILMTAFGNISDAVKAMQAGAQDYIAKPFSPQELIKILNKYISTTEEIKPIISSAVGKESFNMALKVAKNDAAVLISGESGTGKEVVAQYIHHNSDRKEKAFVAINCAAIPENMLEATLFGYEKGAFTGAYNAAPGKFEQANGGTILLDEISEMNLDLQAKLLRVLQEKEVERLGARKTIKLNVRIISTTNRDLLKEIKLGNFREDLFYRINVFPVKCFPLRERKQDILSLAQYFIVKHFNKNDIKTPVLDADAKELLLNYRWPGNVRELENVIQRSLILTDTGVITKESIIFSSDNIEEVILENDNNNENKEENSNLNNNLKQREFDLIISALKEHDGDRKMVAEQLGISPRTLRYKISQMRQQGIKVA